MGCPSYNLGIGSFFFMNIHLVDEVRTFRYMSGKQKGQENDSPLVAKGYLTSMKGSVTIRTSMWYLRTWFETVELFFHYKK